MFLSFLGKQMGSNGLCVFHLVLLSTDSPAPFHVFVVHGRLLLVTYLHCSLVITNQRHDGCSYCFLPFACFGMIMVVDVLS